MKCARTTLAAVALVALALAPLAMAQESGTPQSGITAKLIIEGGGWVGWIIIALSVVCMALAIESVITMRRDKLMPPDILGEIEVLLDDQEYQEAMELCESEPNLLTNMLGPALAKMSLGFAEMKTALSGAVDNEAVRLQQKISWINLIASTATMWGLFGTVVGMVQAFETIAHASGPPEPKALAADIQVALITTLLGLFVAIPAVTYYFYIRNRIVRILIDANGLVDELLERFRQPAEGGS